MGIVCFFNAQHHKYQVQELLGLLSKYLEVESKTLRTGPVLQEELRALKFLHKSARVHIKLDQDEIGEKEEGVVIGTKRPEEEKAGERKRARYTRPFLTTAPLDMSVETPLPSSKDDLSAPIPLPPAHRQLQTSGTSGAFPGDLNLGSTNNNGIGLGHTATPYQAFRNVPSALQYAIKDFSYGDQEFTTFPDYVLPQYAQVAVNQPFDPSSLNPVQHGNGINIAPTPSPNTEAAMWATLNAYASSSGTAYGQVLGHMDNAGAKIGEISPPYSTGDLPGTSHSFLPNQGYEFQGTYGTTGLGIQCGHTPTPMHGGAYYNPGLTHPQPHVYPQANQFLQSDLQGHQIQATRRQSFPTSQTQVQVQLQGQRWSEGMIPQNGILGGGMLPQT